MRRIRAAPCAARRTGEGMCVSYVFYLFCVRLDRGVSPLSDRNRPHQSDRGLADRLQVCKVAGLVERGRVDARAWMTRFSLTICVWAAFPVNALLRPPRRAGAAMPRNQPGCARTRGGRGHFAERWPRHPQLRQRGTSTIWPPAKLTRLPARANQECLHF